MADPVFTTIPIAGTGLRERVVLNEDGTLSRPTQAVFADSSGLASEANLTALKTANHTDLGVVATKLDTLHTDLQAILTAIGLLPQG